jgi:hypothetical protein
VSGPPHNAGVKRAKDEATIGGRATIYRRIYEPPDTHGPPRRSFLRMGAARGVKVVLSETEDRPPGAVGKLLTATSTSAAVRLGVKLLKVTLLKGL